jgi:hypothetical protein
MRFAAATKTQIMHAAKSAQTKHDYKAIDKQIKQHTPSTLGRSAQCCIGLRAKRNQIRQKTNKFAR